MKNEHKMHLTVACAWETFDIQETPYFSKSKEFLTQRSYPRPVEGKGDVTQW